MYFFVWRWWNKYEYEYTCWMIVLSLLGLQTWCQFLLSWSGCQRVFYHWIVIIFLLLHSMVWALLPFRLPDFCILFLISLLNCNLILPLRMSFLPFIVSAVFIVMSLQIPSFFLLSNIEHLLTLLINFIFPDCILFRYFCVGTPGFRFQMLTRFHFRIFSYFIFKRSFDHYF